MSAGMIRSLRRVKGMDLSSFSERDLHGGEPLDDVHGAVAEGALPDRRLVHGRWICWRGLLVEQETAEWEPVLACAVSQPAEVADAGNASG